MSVICYSTHFGIENNCIFGAREIIKLSKLNPMNRTLYTYVIFILTISLLKIGKTTACGFDFTGSCATTARFSVNNVSNEYFLSPCSYGFQLPTSLGTGVTNLQLTAASTRTWESCTNYVMQSAIFYRIYNNAANKGAFIRVDLTQLALFNSPPYRTKTYSGTLNSDLLTGLLPNTTYSIELYYQLFVDSDANNSIDVTSILNNSGAYYTSSFRTGNIATNVGFPVNGSNTNVTCNGGNNATATAAPAGGIAPFTYLWSNNAKTATITGLNAGSYSVTVTDATASIGIRSFTILEPIAVGATLTNTNPACGQTNGTITAVGFGGTSPYTYIWSTNATTPSVNFLAQGAYSVTVKDANNCTGAASTTLIENCGSTNAYCTSNSQAPWGEWIARVRLNTLDNASDKVRVDRYATGYSDWKDKSTTLTKGLSYPLSIMPALSWSGAQTNLFYRVWIDYNKNGQFEDTEKVFEQNRVGLFAVNGTVIVPASSLTGATVMRVSMKKDAYSTACETFSAGEVEDYSIILQIGSGNPCANDATPPTLSNCPSNISLTAANSTAVATWTTPIATDNCTANPTISSNYISGQSFTLGNTTVIYTAKDSSNNTATCSFIVSISKILVTPTVVLKNPTLTVQKNQKVCTSVTVDSFSNILSAQWVSVFNPSVLRFDSLTNLNTALGLSVETHFVTSFSNAGEIRFAWLTTNAVSRPNGEKLYDMCFTTIGAGGTSSALRIDSTRGTLVEVKNNLGQLRKVVVQVGSVSVIDTTIQNNCQKYAVNNTNEICQQTWKPYGMILVQNNVNQYLHSQAVVFENLGITAVLRGTYRTATWAPVQVTINFAGGTTVAPVGSPAASACGGNGTGFTYFTVMSGTVVLNGQTVTIARRGSAFQVGNGANLQNSSDLGAAGQFTLSDGTLGEFGFKLGSSVACSAPDPAALASNNKPILQLNAQTSVDKVQLTWVNNTSFKNDYFEIQKADEQGNFKTIDIINESYLDAKLHDYTFTDSQTVFAKNEATIETIYRIKTVFRDGKALISESKTVNSSNFNDVILYPNPANDKVFVLLKKYSDASIKILIYNTLGTLEKQFNVSNSLNEPIELDLENLKTGHYFMRIVAPGKRDMVKALIIGD